MCHYLYGCSGPPRELTDTRYARLAGCIVEAASNRKALALGSGNCDRNVRLTFKQSADNLLNCVVVLKPGLLHTGRVTGRQTYHNETRPVVSWPAARR